VCSFLEAVETRDLRVTQSALIEPLELAVVLRNVAMLHSSSTPAEGFADALCSEASQDDVLNAICMDARRRGGDMNEALTSPDACGRSPLYKAVKNSCESALPVLLGMGVDVNLGSSDNGWSPLTLAAWLGRSQAVTCLLDHGADPNHDGHSTGWTPLVAAAAASHKKIYRQLLDQGARHVVKKVLEPEFIRNCPDEAVHRSFDLDISQSTDGATKNEEFRVGKMVLAARALAAFHWNFLFV
jgi:ankyrin repeat protein